jgi:IPT/TIG domain/FG-GAP repeat
VPGFKGPPRVATDRSMSAQDTRPLVQATPWRALLLAAVMCALIGAGAWSCLSVGRPPWGAGEPSSVTLRSTIPTGALGPLSLALGAADPAYRMRGSGGTVYASNPAQGMRLRFERSGVLLDSHGVHLGLSLRAVGYGDALHALGHATPSAESNRVAYGYPGIQLWYANAPAGLEQGFTVSRRLAGRSTGPLTLAMTLSGGARASAASTGHSITISGERGRPLRYGALEATDARGRHLHSWLHLDGRAVTLGVDVRGARYPIRVDPLIQQTPTLTGTPATEGAQFGYSVALSADGSTALVGRRSGGGAAWVFTRSGSTWAQQGPPLEIEEEGGGGAVNCEEQEEECYGYSVALSADGNTALIGAPRDRNRRGAAWVFTRSGSTWTQDGTKLTGGEEETGHGGFGLSVALSGDGSTALVGAPADDEHGGAGWVFLRSATGWEQQGSKLTNGEPEATPAHLGRSVALSADGDTALIGGPGEDEQAGAAWVFSRSSSTWEQTVKLTGGDAEIGEGRFGCSVALSAGGDTALIGARKDGHGRGAAWVFARSGPGWGEGLKMTGGEEELHAGEFGHDVALASDGEVALVGAPRDEYRIGAAWVFTRSGSTWTLQGAKLAGLEEGGKSSFGASVALSSTGSTALIGGPGANATSGLAWAFLDTSVPPSASGISAAFGSTAGGTAVTITGGGFVKGDTSVDIGGSAATSVEVLSETELTAVTSAHAVGPAEVSVVDANGSSFDGPTYTYVPPPTVSSISPKSGSTAGGTSVTIAGSGFVQGATTVDIGGAATSVNVLDETKLTALTPAHAAGPENVSVADANGVSTGGPTYTYLVPPAGSPAGTGQSAGGQSVNANAGINVLGNQLLVIPPPSLGLTGNLTPVSGHVFVRLPGSKGFVALTGIRQVPFGTIVNASQGKVTVTTAGPQGALQALTFYAGEFKLTQNRRGLVVATLYGGNYAVCPTKRERAHLAATSPHHSSSKHPVRKLWAEGHGSYSTKGSYASGAVLGTRWLTEDLCYGTLIHVSTDRVVVTNLVNHHRVIVKAGHTYIARAP